MDVASALRQIASADDLHGELVIDLVVVLEEGNELGLNDVNRVVPRVVG